MKYRPFLLTFGILVLLGGLGFGGWAAHRVWSRTSSEPCEGVFLSLQDPEMVARLYEPIEGAERRVEEVWPFRLGGKEMAAMVFATYALDEQGNRMGGHAEAPMLGVAVFERMPNGAWRCTDFRPEFQAHGSFGNRGAVSLAFLGPTIPALVLRGGFTGQGVTTSGSSYHRLLDGEGRLALTEVLSLREDYDNSGSGLGDAIAHVEAKTEILAAEIKDGWYPVRIAHHGTVETKDAEGRGVARRTVNESVTFVYDPIQKTYQPQVVSGTSVEGWWKGGDEAMTLGGNPEELKPSAESAL